MVERRVAAPEERILSETRLSQQIEGSSLTVSHEFTCSTPSSNPAGRCCFTSSARSTSLFSDATITFSPNEIRIASSGIHGPFFDVAYANGTFFTSELRGIG